MVFGLFYNRCSDLPRSGGRKGLGFDSVWWEEIVFFSLVPVPHVTIPVTLLKEVGAVTQWYIYVGVLYHCLAL